MLITCSYCKASYSLSTNQLSGAGDSIFTCKQCQRSIKITSCPHCNFFYSITFSAPHHRYSFRCRRCEKSFIVEFPVVQNAVGSRPPISEKVPSERIKRSREDSGKGVTHRYRDEVKKPSGGVFFENATFKEFSLKELLTVCSGAFSKAKLIVSASGMTVLILIMLLYREIEGLLYTAPVMENSRFLNSLLNLFPVFLFFFVVVLMLALISRITLEKIFLDSVWNFRKAIKFASKIAMPVFVSCIVILFLGNLVFILSGMIPIVGPVLYSILFLPIYVISLLIVITLVIGIWFYPPILAYKEVGVLKNISHLFHFVKRHNFSLIVVIPILVITSSLIFALIYLLHRGAFSIAISLSKIALQNNVGEFFSAIPLSMSLSDLSFLGTDINIYRSLMTDLLLSHKIGGFIIGVVLATISIFLFASYLSVIGTLSSHVYIVMERSIDISDRKKITLLLMLLLLLLGIYIVKKIFV
jgi:hypothetical protein